MAKRARSAIASQPTKRARLEPDATSTSFNPNKVATAEAAETVTANPPLPILLKAVEDSLQKTDKGRCVIYWMRMADLRGTCRGPVSHVVDNSWCCQLVADNKALSQASAKAHEDNIPLVAMFLFSPQDYIAHDRSSRRIDFTLRNLREVKVRARCAILVRYSARHLEIA